MTIDSSAIDMLSQSGRSAKFTQIGDIVKGSVVSMTKTQQTDFDTGELLFWDNGDPRWQLVIALQTDDRDADDATDDGVRKLYAKGAMLKAIQGAFREANATPDVGGTLAVEYIGDGEAKKRGMSPPKLYRAQYKAPSVIAAEVSDLI